MRRLLNLNFKLIRMNSGVGTVSYLILFLRAIGFSKMTKSYHVNKILEPSYLGIFPWVLLTLANLMIHLCFFEKFNVMSSPTIFCHCILPYEMVSISLFIHEKCHCEKGEWMLRGCSCILLTATRLFICKSLRPP